MVPHPAFCSFMGLWAPAGLTFLMVCALEINAQDGLVSFA